MKCSLPLIVLLFVSSQILSLNAADKAQYAGAIQTARREIWKSLSSGSASAATVAIMDNGKVVYSEGFGMRDRESALPIDRNTQFNIGSISKIFTAAAVLLLVDDGKLDLDQPVTTYLPEFTTQDERYKDITVRMLLNHTSGLPGTNGKNGFGSEKNPDYVPETLVFLAENGIKSTPGESSVYCNDGFTVAEAVVEKVSGMSFAEFLGKRIFKPMKMKNSSCFFKDGNTNIARVYSTKTGSVEPVEYVSVMGSGGLASTPEDLCRYGTVLFRNRLFSATSLEEYTIAQYGPETALGEVPYFNCGLGWDFVAVAQFADQGVTVIAKNGGTQEFSSQLYVDAKDKLCLAIVYAGGGADASGTAEKIMQALLEGKGIIPVKPDAPELPLPGAVIPNEILAYAGYYANNNSVMKVAFDTTDNALQLYKYASGGFSLSQTIPYKNDGYFHGTSSKLKFVTQNQTRYIMSDSPKPFVYVQNITPLSGAPDGSAFSNKQWLFRNVSNYDFATSLATTGTIAELPGYVYCETDGSYMLDKLSTVDTAVMCLPYARDILNFSTYHDEGKAWLKFGLFLYSEDKDTAVLTDGETVTIGARGLNEWRQISAQTILDCTMPADGRILIFSQDQTCSGDTLFGMEFPLIVNAGDRICFIGEAGDTFTITLSGN